jgi:signal transduction histidine kinase
MRTCAKFTRAEEAGPCGEADAGGVSFTKGALHAMIASMKLPRGRIPTLDVVIAVLASAVAVVYMIDDVQEYDVSAVAVPFFVLVTLPLLWRRTAPLFAMGAALGGELLHFALFGQVIRCGIVLPVMLVLVFSVGARLDLREALTGLGLGLALALTVCLTDSSEGADPAAMTFLVPLALAIWGVGRLVHSRGRMVGELEARTKELRATRDERARLEVATDRARLSAELDELLQRRLGELASLADQGSRGDASAATATLAQIEQESRRTLDEMRAIVGVLRHDESDAPVTPQPTLTHLDAMLVRAKGDGTRLTVEGNPRALPAGVELSAYRIVEQLLDALQDAPGVEVSVHFADDALELTVAGPMRRRGEEAIERARERVQLHRGTLRSSTSDGRAEAIVSLPILATV